MNIRYVAVAFFTLLWAAILISGTVLLWQYALSPGIAAVSPSQWPSETTIAREAGQYTLVMLAHPHCPCTRASIAELSLIMARTSSRISARVLFFKPAGSSDQWAKTDLWDSASAIPGVMALVDDDGREASRFGAVTSGQTMLFDPEGRLLFSGGITPARGHQGDNLGVNSVVAAANANDPVTQAWTPVFGCALIGNPDCKEALCLK